MRAYAEQALSKRCSYDVRTMFGLPPAPPRVSAGGGYDLRGGTALYASDLVDELTFFSSLASETPPSRRRRRFCLV